MKLIQIINKELYLCAKCAKLADKDLCAVPVVLDRQDKPKCDRCEAGAGVYQRYMQISRGEVVSSVERQVSQ